MGPGGEEEEEEENVAALSDTPLPVGTMLAMHASVAKTCPSPPLLPNCLCDSGRSARGLWQLRTTVGGGPPSWEG